MGWDGRIFGESIVAWWGALLATALAVHEFRKRRQDYRACLAARTKSRVVWEDAEAATNHGVSHTLVVHNAGGKKTTIRRAQLVIPRSWVPTPVLPILCACRVLPVSTDSRSELAWGPGAFSHFGVEVGPGDEATLRPVLWREHRDALKRGRLVLRVRHTWTGRAPDFLIVSDSP